MAVIILPDMVNENADLIFPIYMMKYLAPGMLGVGMAALMLASQMTIPLARLGWRSSRRIIRELMDELTFWYKSFITVTDL